MRITSSYIYQKNLSDYQSKMFAYSKLNEQLGNGLKIGQSYDDAGIYSEHIRLDYELSTFDQIIQAGQSAVSFTKNSDNTVKQIKDALVSFKNQLIKSANEIHSDTSLNAIANDLEKLKEHIVNLANTSINGQYLFSGTNINKKPFEYSGDYNGNKENMKVLLGSNVYAPYNISGYELMKSKDNDYHKTISTNIRMIDRRYDINKPEQIHYIDENNKIRDLIGKNYLKAGEKSLNVDEHFKDNDGANFPDTYFYVRATKGNSDSIRAKFKMKANESVGALVNKIGELFGNTKDNKLVDVVLSKNGNIEITDLKYPESKINFSMFAATAKADDIAQLYPPKPTSPEELEHIKNEVEANKKDKADNKENDKTTEGVGGAAEEKDKITGKVEPKKHTIPAATLNPIPVDSKKASVKNPSELRNKDDVFVLEFTNNANIANGYFKDGLDYSRSLFNKKDNVLSSNISQIDKSGNIANNDTRLFQTSLSPLKFIDDKKPETDSVLQIDITSRNKVHYSLEFNITKAEVSAKFKDANNEDVTRKFPITNVVYDNNLHKSDSVKTENTDITYKQLSDVIALFASDNIPSADYKLEKKYEDLDNSPMILSNDNHNELQQLLKQANASLQVGLDERGRLTLVDKASTNTNIELSIFDKSTMSKDEFDFGTKQVQNDKGETVDEDIDEGVKKGDIFNFNTNSTLIIDENHVDIIKDLDEMIKAVRSGNYRADNKNAEYVKNIGIQGSLKRLDHIFDHINKIHTKIGAIQNSIEENNDRATAMHLNIETVKSSVSDADPAIAAVTIKQIIQSLESTMYTTSQIQKLSLLSYM